MEMTAPLFDARAPRLAPFGLVGWIFVGTLLGAIPLVGVLTLTFSLPAEDPSWWAYLPVFWLVALIPVAILFAVYRAFTRFRLTVEADGAIIFVQPFKTTRLAKGQVASAIWSSAYVAATRTRVNWLILSGPDGAKIEAISPMSFGEGALNDFVETLKQVDPALRTTAS
jgi:hypothetical protein